MVSTYELAVLSTDSFRDDDNPVNNNVTFPPLSTLLPGATWVEVPIDIQADVFQPFRDQGFDLLGAEDFGARTYFNTITNEVVISFTGLDDPLNDLADFTSLANGTATVLLAAAVLYVEHVKSTVIVPNGSDVTLTGGSGGGALASLISMREGWDATVFNPAAAGAMVQGPGDFRDGISVQTWPPIGVGGNTQADDSLIKNITTNGEVLSDFLQEGEAFLGQVEAPVVPVSQTVLDALEAELSFVEFSILQTGLHRIAPNQMFAASPELQQLAIDLPLFVPVLAKGDIFSGIRNMNIVGVSPDTDNPINYYTKMAVEAVQGGDVHDALVADLQKIVDAGTEGILDGVINGYIESLIQAAIQHSRNQLVSSDPADEILSFDDDISPTTLSADLTKLDEIVSGVAETFAVEGVIKDHIVTLLEMPGALASVLTIDARLSTFTDDNTTDFLIFDVANTGVTVNAPDGQIIMATGDGQDTVNGSIGPNLILSGGGQDLITTGIGDFDDVIFAGIGDDTIIGSQGNDFIHGHDAENAFFTEAVKGSDTVNYQVLTGGIEVKLDDNLLFSDIGTVKKSDTPDGPVTGTDILFSIENIVGTNFDDVFIDSKGQANTFDGRLGTDTVDYADHFSLLFGGSITVDLNTGTDSDGNTLIGIERIVAGNTSIEIVGSAADEILEGGAAQDILRGGAGADAFVLNALEPAAGGDFIHDAPGDGTADSIQISNALPAEVFLAQNSGNLELYLGSSLDTLLATVVDFFEPGGAVNVGSLTFDNGAVVDITGLDSGDLGAVPVEGLPTEFVAALAQFEAVRTRVDPLILDLDGNGFTGTVNSSFYFDMDADGLFAEAIQEWATSGDGFIVIDFNNNDIVDDGSELLNNMDGAWNALQGFDDNGDDVIDSQDAIWSQVHVWQDKNSDGQTQSDEFFTMGELGIVAVNIPASGMLGSVTTNTGSLQVEDVEIGTDPRNTQFVGDVDISLESLVLPDIRGFNTVADLRIAMNLDSSLLSQAQDLATQELPEVFGDFLNFRSDFTSMLFQWGGVQNISPTSRGVFLSDARILEFMEDYFGEGFFQARFPEANPLSLAAVSIENVFSSLQDSMVGKFIFQMGGSSLFSTPGQYDISTDQVVFDTNPPLVDAAALLELGQAGASAPNAISFWGGVAFFIGQVRGGFTGFTQAELDALNDAVAASDPLFDWDDAVVASTVDAADVNLTGSENADLLVGGAGNDVLTGNGGDDILQGNAGFDHLIGGDGNDTLSDGTGSDLMEGGLGDDVYIWEGGLSDFIFDAGGFDVIRVANPNSVEFERIFGDDLLLRIGSDTVALQDQLNFSGNFPLIEEIQDLNGTTFFDLINLDTTIITQGTDGDDTLLGIQVGNLRDDDLRGGDGNDTLLGGEGDDILRDGNGNDILQGGIGNDILISSKGNNTLEGGTGDDFYFFENSNFDSSRLDIISDTGGNDVLQMQLFGFEEPRDFVFERFLDSNDLRVTSPGDSRGSVILKNQLDETNAHLNAIEEIRDRDGNIVFDMADFSDARAILITASAGDDVIDGFSFLGIDTYKDEIDGLAGNDIISGGGGNDELRGGSGNDQLFGGAGDDRIFGDAGADELFGGAGDDLLLGDANDILVDGGDGDDEIFANSVDTVFGGAGNDDITGGDVINPGIGNDRVSGSGGANHIFYTSGFDVYTNLSSNDIIELPAGITFSQLAVTRGGENLIVGIDANNQITLENYFNVTFAPNPIFRLNDGTGDFRISDTTQVSIIGTSVGDDITGNRFGFASIDDVIFGLGGDDVITDDTATTSVHTGNDIIFAGDGNDTINVNRGADEIHGGDGDDSIFIRIADSSSADILDGGAGVDTLDLSLMSGTSTQVVVNLSDGTLFFGSGKTGTIIAIENVRGDDAGDSITGDGGDNHLEGLRGNDVILGGEGDDLLDGQNDNDQLFGDAGNDTLLGGGGSDHLTGGLGDDSIDGGSGDDTYFFAVGDGQDSIFESSGTDTIKITTAGLTTSDIVFGRIGNDLVINVGAGGDSIFVDRHFISASNQVEVLELEDGTILGLTNPVLSSLVDGVTLIGTALDENLVGAADNDLLSGGGGNDTLTGGLGNDLLDGGTDDDTFVFLSRNHGIDEISDMGGIDTIQFGPNFSINDFIFSVQGDDVHIDTGEPGNSVIVRGQNGADPNLLIESIEVDGFTLDFGTFSTNWFFTGEPSGSTFRILGTTGDDVIINQTSNATLLFGNNDGNDVIIGNDLSEIILTNDGNDILFGGGGNDRMFGEDNDDFLDGGDGNDFLAGGKGTDILQGGDGDDTYGGGAFTTSTTGYLLNRDIGTDIISDTGGIDTLRFELGAVNNTTNFNPAYLNFEDTGTGDLKITWTNPFGTQFNNEIIIEGQLGLDTSKHIEKFDFGSFVLELDQLTAIENWIKADAAFIGQTLTGDQNGILDDVIFGSQRDDVLIGGAGNDFIFSGFGADVIIGGSGNDTLIGGATFGDRFIYEAGVDTIRDLGGNGSVIQFDGLSIADVTFTSFNKIIVNEGVDEVSFSGGNFNFQFDDILTNFNFTHINQNGTDGNDRIVSAESSDGGRGDDIIAGTKGNDILDGSEGNDLLLGGSGNDVLMGGTEDDELIGGDGDDILDGGDNEPHFRNSGSDILRGGAGNDTFLFGKDGGADTIEDTQGVDTILFDEGIRLDELVFTRVGDDLVIDIDSSGQNVITITNHFVSGDSIENLEFDDGTVFDITNPVINRDPEAFDDSLGGAVDQQIIGNVLDDNGFGADRDVDNNPLSVQAVTGLATAQGGSVDILIDGTFIFTPPAGFLGLDSFDYTLFDGLGGSDTGTVSLNVALLANEAPVAQNDSFNVDLEQPFDGDLLADNGNGVDSDPDGDILSVLAGTFLTAEDNAVEIRADGTFTFTPAPGFAGIDSFTYTVADGKGGFDTATASLNVGLEVIISPEAQDDVFEVFEGQDLDGNVLSDNGNGNDFDPDGGTLSVATITKGTLQGGVVTINSDGTFTYSPPAGFNGPDSFNYTLLDGTGNSDRGFVSINVVTPNEAPVAQDDAFTGSLNSNVVGNVLDDNGNGVDSDPDGDPLTVFAEIRATAQGGAVIIDADGSFTYTPSLDFVGSDSFDYILFDSLGQAAQGTAAITVQLVSVNQDPVAQDDNFTVLEDGILAGNVLLDNGNGADTDPDNDPLTVVGGIFATANGQVTLNSDGTFDYTPNANFFGSDSFDYTIQDGNGGEEMATAFITVNSVNDTPVAQPDLFTTNEGTVLINVNVLVNDSDVDIGDMLTVETAFFITSEGASVSIDAAGNLEYTPVLNFFGQDSFSYTVMDQSGSMDVGTVTIDVLPVNDTPEAQDDNFTVNEDTDLTGNVLADNGNAADFDVDGDLLSVVAATLTTPNGGTVELLVDGSFTYTPALNFNGLDSFEYTVGDGQGASDIGIVNIDVLSVNDVPEARGDSFTVNEDTALTGDVLADNGSAADFDVDGDILSVQAATIVTAAGATVILNTDGTFEYTPALNFNGADSFEYTVEDGQGGSDTATANITVNPVNDAPVTQDDLFTTDEDAPVSGNVLDNDSDIDTGDVLSAIAGTFASDEGGQVVLNSDGSFDYTPAANFNGVDSFTYTAQDLTGVQVQGLARIEVAPVNDAPVAQDDSFSMNEDDVLNVNVLLDNGNGADSDIDGDTLSTQPAFFITAAGASVSLDAAGNLQYTPELNFNGIDSFSYTVTDGNGGQDTATVNIDVTPVNDAPVAADDVFVTDEDTALPGNVLADNGFGADSDVDGDILTVVGGTFNTAQGGIVILNSDGTFDYTPAANFNGADSFEYTVEDGNGGSDMAMANITVNSVNDEPVAADDIFTIAENAIIINGDLLADNGNGVDSDVDGDALTVVANTFTTTAGNEVTIRADGTFDYTPVANFNGPDSFEYTVTDGNGGQDIGAVAIDVAPANTAPEAQDDSFAGEIMQTITGNVLANDSDVDGDTLLLQAAVLSTIAGATVTLLENGDFTYTPPSPVFLGVDSFEYTVLDGQGGFDTATVNIEVSLPEPTIIGTEGKDRLKGGDDDDVIFGLGGKDKLDGKDGNDILVGGAGKDKLDGGRGDDKLLGGDGNDRLDGDKGNDSLDGGAGEDKLKGGRGDDNLDGGDGNDRLDGGKGDDVLNGGAGNDKLDGGKGDDVLDGGAGDDKLKGGNGNDILIGDDDSAESESETTHSFTKSNPRGSDRGGDIKNIETSFNETTNQFSFELVVSDPHGKDTNGFTLVINDGPNPKGNPGEMAIMYFDASGGEPVVSVYGYNGLNNFSSFKDGAPDAGIQTPDQIMSSLETGNPFTDITATTDAHGNNVFSFTLDATAITEHMPLHGTEEAWNGLSFADKLGMWLHPQTNLDTEYGEDGFLTQWDYASQGWFDSVNSRTETTTTGSNNDELDGGKGNDQLFGGVGDDELDGGKGNDFLDGGTGNDELEGGKGDDQLFGGDGNDELESGKGDDLLYGGAGDDELEGDKGDDVLVGGAGDDRLDGGKGDDIILMGEGEDKAYGGKGADQFVFEAFDAISDTIFGFETGDNGDVLNLTDILHGFDPLSAAISDFVQISENGDNAEIQINTDGDAGGTFTTIAVIEGGVDDLTVLDLLNAGNLVVDQSVMV